MVVKAEAVGEGVLALLQALYEQHDQANIVFATNWDEARVDAAGLAFDTLHQQYPRLVYVKSVFMMHVGCTRCVTSNTDHHLKIRARMGVDLIRACMFLFFLYVHRQ